MAQRASYKKRNSSFSARALGVLVLMAAACSVLFFGFGVAQGDDSADDSTVGIGEVRSTIDASVAEAPAAEGSHQIEASEQPEMSVSDPGVLDGQRVTMSSAESLKTAQQRTFTVEDPEPTIVLAAVDTGDVNTVAAAAAIGTTNPMPTAQCLREDTSGEEWLTGIASAYDVASSSTLTYSGRSFDDNCVTVAVPQGMEEYVGRPVEIVWNDQVVVATVTDTGGFAKYGRCLDLGGGVWKAFGCETVAEWGLQTVTYRYL